MPEQALSHLKVLDLTHYLAGPFCTKLMAGFGAEVIKVEKPRTGDGLREVGPFYQGIEGRERSIPFLWLNTGKKSITLNINSPEGREILSHLICDADILIENFAPGVMERFGFGFDAVHRLQPRVIMTSIKNFGQSGPYADYKAEEITEYAMSGLMQLTGRPDRPPLCCGPAMSQYTAAIQAYFATVLAIWQREITGVGQHVNVSIRESNLDNVEVALTEYLHTGKVPNRNSDEHALVPWKLYPCKNGYAAIIGGPMRHWPGAVSMFENTWLMNPDLQHMGGRIKHRAEVGEAILPWLAEHEKKEIYEAGQRRGLAFGYLADADEIFHSPQHQARSFFVSVDHPSTGPQPYCGAPFRSSVNSWRLARAPLLGEHTEAIITQTLGYTREDLARFRAQGVVE